MLNDGHGEKGDRGVVLALFLLLLVRACAYGVIYWPQLDDYIQYHNYLKNGTFAELQELVGILGARPLAGIADYFFWGRMFPWMIVGVAVVSLLYAMTGVMLKKQLGRYFTIGPVFLVIFTLFPLGVEGTYWMSASTRIVCGLFFAVLASGAFLRWMDTGRPGWALLFVLLQLLPLGFYEQAGIFSVTLVIGLAILEVIAYRGQLLKALLSLWAVPAMGIYFGVTHLLSAGTLYSSRTEIIPPNTPYWWDTFLPEVLHQFKAVFLEGLFHTLFKGFIRTVREIFSGELLLWMLIVVGACVLFWYLYTKMACGLPQPEIRALSPWLALLAGALLFLAPLTVFLVLANPWFSMRGAVTSFGGLALIYDILVTQGWKYLPGFKKGPAVLAAFMAFVFCIAGASEIRDYRDTWRADQQIGAAVTQSLRDEVPNRGDIDSKERIGVLNILPSYLDDQNYFYHEHIHGCTQSPWAFQGLLTYLDGDKQWNVTPLPTTPIYYHWNQESNRPETFDRLYFYNGISVEPVELEQTGEYDFLVRNRADRPIGRIWEEDDMGYFQTME